MMMMMLMMMMVMMMVVMMVMMLRYTYGGECAVERSRRGRPSRCERIEEAWAGSPQKEFVSGAHSDCSRAIAKCDTGSFELSGVHIAEGGACAPDRS